METTHNILERYAAADEDQRLSMFLNYRDLRRHFIQMDMAAENRSRATLTKPKRALPGSARLLGMAGCCWGWIKHGRLAK